MGFAISEVLRKTPRSKAARSSDVRIGCGFLENKQGMNLLWFQLSPTA
jgi:hypothetical protein